MHQGMYKAVNIIKRLMERSQQYLNFEFTETFRLYEMKEK